jgi:hypothetical protein
MDLVIDTLFADSLEFTIPTIDLTNRAFPSLEDQTRFACESIGLELMGYDTSMVTRKPDGLADVRLYGKVWVRARQR